MLCDAPYCYLQAVQSATEPFLVWHVTENAALLLSNVFDASLSTSNSNHSNA